MKALIGQRDWVQAFLSGLAFYLGAAALGGLTSRMMGWREIGAGWVVSVIVGGCGSTLAWLVVARRREPQTPTPVLLGRVVMGLALPGVVALAGATCAPHPATIDAWRVVLRVAGASLVALVVGAALVVVGRRREVGGG